MELPVKYDELSVPLKKTVREQYVIEQGGNCYYCSSSLKLPPPKEILEKKVNKDLFPNGFFRWPVHLHHSHETGLTIGAVHNYCNAVLWQYHGE